MTGTHRYDLDGFLAEFFPDVFDRRAVEDGAAEIVAANRVPYRAHLHRGWKDTQGDTPAQPEVQPE